MYSCISVYLVVDHFSCERSKMKSCLYSMRISQMNNKRDLSMHGKPTVFINQKLIIFPSISGNVRETAIFCFVFF